MRRVMHCLALCFVGIGLSAAACSSRGNNGDGITVQPGDTRPLSVRQANPGLCDGSANRTGDGKNSSGGAGAAAPVPAAGTTTGTGGPANAPASDAGLAPSRDAGPSVTDCGDAGDAGCNDSGGSPLPNPPTIHARSLQDDSSTNTCAGLDTSKPTTLYLSADDSNSMASPAIVRRMITLGATTFPPRIVRTWEFLNYYRFAFEPAPQGRLSIVSQLGSCDLKGDLALQIAVQSERAPEVRPPMNVTLVLDTSGSMEQNNRISLETAAIVAIARSLREGDLVSAVTWSDQQKPELVGHVVQGPNDPALLALAARITANGSTDLNGGLRAGYTLAEQFRDKTRLNRVVIISDGQANVGVTNEKLIGDKAEDRDGEGIYLVGIGVGDGFNDTLMDTVTDAGRGAYIYLDTEAEAERVLHGRFAESFMVAARSVKIELTLPWYFQMQKFYGEEYSPDPTKVRAQHLAPDDSMMLFQVLRSCDPSLPKMGDPYRVRVTWQDPVTGASREEVQETVLGSLGIDDGRLSKAAAIVAYTEALKRLVALPDASARKAELANAASVIAQANAVLSDPDLDELLGLLTKVSNNQR